MPLRISADTRYKLYVNGHFAEFGPAKGDVVPPWGMVYVEWEKDENGKLNLCYQVPEHMKERVQIHV